MGKLRGDHNATTQPVLVKYECSLRKLQQIISFTELKKFELERVKRELEVFEEHKLQAELEFNRNKHEYIIFKQPKIIEIFDI